MKTQTILSLGITGAMFTGASAATITIDNAGFDATSVGDGLFTAGVVTDWSVAGGGGTVNPTAANATPTSGDNVAYASDGSAVVSQSTGHALLADTIYTLTVNVGSQAAFDDLSWKIQLVTLDGVTLTDYAQAFLNDDGPAVTTGTQDGTTSAGHVYGGVPALGTLTQATLTWTTGAAPTGLGDDLTVRLIGAAGDQAIFDDVALSYVPVPEPSSTALLGLGGLALILRRRI